MFDAIKSRLPPSIQINYEVGAYAHKMLPILDKGIKSLHSESSGATIRFFNEKFSGSPDKRQCICEEQLQDLDFQLMDYNRNPKLNYELFYATVEAEFTPDADGPWDFGLTVCGTANLYVDDKLVIDNTTSQQPGEAFFKKGTVEKIVQVTLDSKKTYKLRIEFGSANTSKLMSVGVVSFGGGGARLGACQAIRTETLIANAVKLAAESQHVVLCTGLNASILPLMCPVLQRLLS
jgi:beta-glucosidase